MQNLRKLLAVLVTLTMLCALLPLSALSVSAAQVNLITNGDFEDGTTGWVASDGASVKVETVDAAHGKSGKFYGDMDVTVYQDIPVNANTNYTISVDLNIPTNHISVWVTGGIDGTAFHTRSKVETKPGWQTKTYSFNSGNNTYIRLAFACRYWAYDYFVDNVVMMGEPTDNVVPEPDNPPAVEIPGNMVQNGTFEAGNDGWTLYQGSTTTEDAAYTGDIGMHLIGAGGWGAMATQDITTVVGQKYAFSAVLKKVAEGANIQIKDADGNKLVGKWCSPADWTQVSLEFTATSTTTSIVFCGAGNGNAESVYLDDVCVTPLQEESFDGYIRNGNFETGSLSPWGYWQSTTISRDAAYAGNFGVKMIGDGGWGGTLRQDFAIEPGMTYKLSFWYKPVSNGINVQLVHKDRTDIETKYLNSKNGKEWTLFEVTFEAGYSDGAYLNFCGSGIGTKDEVWVDEIKLENLSGGELDRTQPLKNNGVSIRDVDDNVRGLAFRFTLDVNGAQTSVGNRWAPGTGQIKLYNYADTMGTLIETGAVVTNVESIGTGDMTIADADGKKTVKVAAEFITDVTDTSLSFAVRVIEIPDAYTGTTIYARPYYTYELDGQQVTIYGDIVSDNYAAVAAVRTSIKILAIGNSFSVDAMRNHLYDVLKSAGHDQVILGNLYVGGCSLDQHWGYINGKQKAYEYFKNDDNGKWVSTVGYDALTALREETWDIITVQQASPNSGQPNTFGNLSNIVNWIEQNKTNNDAKIFWHMTWAYQQNSTHSAFPNYGSNQMQMYNAIVNAAENTAMKVEGIDGIIPAGTAIQNLRGTKLGDTLTADGYHLSDTYGDYTASLMWYVALTGGSLDEVTYVPNSVSAHIYNVKRAVARAYYQPYAVSDLTETVLLAGSDFQTRPPQTGLNQIDAILGGIEKTDGYTHFDGLLMGGDYTADHGHDNSVIGLQALKPHMAGVVNHNLIYSEGNHDAPTVEGLTPTGNNDPLNGAYGLFVINEEDYGQFGGGGDVIAVQLKDYLDEKVGNKSWGNKPVFVLCHVPLHYSYRTLLDQQGRTAMPIVNALNDAGSKGLNVIFLFGHNHSDEYDAYLGGSSVYLKKGDTMLVPSTANYKEYQSVKLNFTYMNVGYVGGYPASQLGSDSTLTMTTFRIQADGAVIITRYDKNGYHNLKSKGVVNTNLADKCPANETVYGPSRIVTATSDEEYTGD
ncbi:MAG: DUF4886 domain-containing protein [Clostridia bacterium]|nr:DUF4886 domain-containing protein [Clostridia bacterium]